MPVSVIDYHHVITIFGFLVVLIEWELKWIKRYLHTNLNLLVGFVSLFVCVCKQI